MAAAQLAEAGTQVSTLGPHCILALIFSSLSCSRGDPALRGFPASVLELRKCSAELAVGGQVLQSQGEPALELLLTPEDRPGLARRPGFSVLPSCSGPQSKGTSCTVNGVPGASVQVVAWGTCPGREAWAQPGSASL